MDILQIRTLLNWMQSIELGPGDLTTETISPYALHSEGSAIALFDGLFSGREALEILFEESGRQLAVEWKVCSGDSVKTGDVLFEFNGNGADILKNRRLIHWIIGRMSGMSTAAATASKLLKANGKGLVQGISENPIFDVFDELAFETGGGIWKRHGLTDSIYVTQEHIRYAGSIDKCLSQLNQEIGDTRKTLKIEIEVNTTEQFKRINEMDYDTLHLVGLTDDDIRNVFESLNPVKKPILHLAKLGDFKAHYADYFFKYCAIEELHRNLELLDNRIVFQNKCAELF
ncbi:MAG: hypothetical protein JXR87_08620 [Candidatus Marinimicrobia bacterium]|nr:hypothetical protein [Candidatus Neomarinimicrobiota bacterium]